MRVRSHGTRLTSVILGSLVIFGSILLLGALVGIVPIAIQIVLGTSGAPEGGSSGLMGVSLSLLLAFYAGGYVAGRRATRCGVKHGPLLILLAIVVGIFLMIVGALGWCGLVNALSGAELPSTLEDIANLSVIMSTAGVLALILPFVGGVMAGVRGAHRGRRRLHKRL
jgi:hypothetical protein